MNWSSRKKSTMVNAVTLLLCAVALGKVNTNIIEVYGQQLQQQQHQNNNSDSDSDSVSDIQRKLITFFSIKNHEDTDPTKKPTHAPTPHQAYESDDYFNEGSYPTAKVSQMPTPYGQPTDRPTPRPTPEPTPHPTTKNTPAPSRRTPPGPIPYQQYYPPKPIASPSTLPTPRPTPVPTNLPTPDPTPQPTLPPTEAPTRNPTPDPTPQPTTGMVDPTSKPSPSPSAAPTTNPSDQPTAHPSTSPSKEPTAEPSAEPTVEPTAEPTVEPTAEPSAEPTAEPSSEPSFSEEPSENPTNSEEPSEVPTQSLEPTSESSAPSSSPVVSMDSTRSSPTEAPDPADFFSLAGIICNPENADVFSIFCSIIQQFPAIENMLDGNSRRKLGVVGIGRADSQGDSQLLTLFAPTDKAFERLVLPDEINTMDFGDLKNKEERMVAMKIINNHIFGRFKSFHDLECNDVIRMRNGQQTQTRCYTNNRLIIQKFQIGSASSAFGEDIDNVVLSLNAPKIIGKDVKASNGILQAVKNVIMPDLEGSR